MNRTAILPNFSSIGNAAEEVGQTPQCRAHITGFANPSEEAGA
jgi:hypothetical protein